MKTVKIYENDPYCREFTATVTGCRKEKGKYITALSQSAFFPEGGGQPGDRGTIGDIRVTDTHETEGVIWHTTDAPLNVGETVACRLDWNFRYANMQNHAGEHIVSGLIHQLYGYDNVGFHMGSQSVTIDMNGDISWEALKEVEQKANMAVRLNLPIEIMLPDDATLTNLEYRSKKEIDGQVRIVRIEGYDCCACCGTHPARTGEIQMIKLLSVQNYKGGVRISMLSGIRAFEDYMQKHEQLLHLSRSLSAKIEDVQGAVDRLSEENGRLKYEKTSARKELLALKAEQAIRYYLSETGKSREYICIIDETLSGNEPREYADFLADTIDCVLVLVPGNGHGSGGKNQETTMRYVLIDRKQRCREIGKILNETFGGRGGGSPEMFQGTCAGVPEAVKHWLEEEL